MSAGRIREDRPHRVAGDPAADERARAIASDRSADPAELTAALRDALAARYAQTSPATRASGRAWYPTARATARAIAEANGLPVRRVAGVIAALSPRKHWHTNVRAATQLCEARAAGASYPGVHFRQAQDPAEAILNGRSRPVDALTGPKVGAFYRAIVGDADALTLDVWAVRAAGIDEGLLSRKPIRAAIDASYRELAAATGERVADLQAILWIACRGTAPSDSGAVA